MCSIWRVVDGLQKMSPGKKRASIFSWPKSLTKVLPADLVTCCTRMGISFDIDKKSCKDKDDQNALNELPYKPFCPSVGRAVIIS